MPSLNPAYTWSDQPVVRSSTSVGYRVGLALVSVMMVLLPAIYLLICGTLAYGIYLFAIDDVWLLGMRQVGIVAYLGMMVAGAIGFIFMVKPLFKLRPRTEAFIEVKREAQPQLFAFIDEVCTRVGAPKPRRVRLDNRVNASASFEHGWWGALTGRLVLTIGLPIAQGLTVSQFGGVLAHEFGHFTQAMAMRFNYSIRSTNDWFGRVIFERDRFDASLAQLMRRGHIYTILAARVAGLFVWLVRRILWMLMRAGHAVSAYLMRQMEYDADHYQLEVSGPHNFRETFLLMRLMAAGEQMSNQHLAQLWQDGRLVDNVPLLTQQLFATIPPETVQQARANLDADHSVAEWHASHPSDAQRIARSTLFGKEGALRGDEPATALFENFEGISKQLTLVDYKKRFRLKFKHEALVPTESHMEKHLARAARIKLMTEFFGGLLHEHRFLFPESHGDNPLTVEEARALYFERAQTLEAHRVAAEALRKEIDAARTRRAQGYVANTLRQMRVKFQPGKLGLPNAKPAMLKKVVTESTAEIDQKRDQLEPVLMVAEQKLFDLCQISQCPDWLERIQGLPDWSAWTARITMLWRTLVAIRPIHVQLNAARKSLFIASVCAENFRVAKNKKWTNEQFESCLAEFRPIVREIENISRAIPYPLQDGKPHANLMAYFSVGIDQSKPVGSFHYLRAATERYTYLYTELMLELLEKAGAVEQASMPQPVE